MNVAFGHLNATNRIATDQSSERSDAFLIAVPILFRRVHAAKPDLVTSFFLAELEGIDVCDLVDRTEVSLKGIKNEDQSL
ncbi:MAG: hypothetical protein JW884_05420 [Deltaproteobacteria bacterium]|nr:hypothetical protein [Deltaproteobacteria bacterium]